MNNKITLGELLKRCKDKIPGTDMAILDPILGWNISCVRCNEHGRNVVYVIFEPADDE